MGMTEIPRPAVFKSEGIWFNAGTFEMHIGVEENVAPHGHAGTSAYEVDDVAAWRKKVEAAKLPIKAAEDPELRPVPFSRSVWEQY